MNIATLILLAIAGAVSATEVTFAGNQQVPFIAKDMVPEVVGFIVSFSSEISKEDKRNKAIETAVATFMGTVGGNPDILVMTGDPDRQRDYTASSGSFGLGHYGVVREDGAVKNSTFLMIKVGNGEVPTATGKRLIEYAQGIKLNDDVRVNLLGFYQGVLDANKYREELVGSIMADAKKYGGGVEISGLERSVVVSNVMNGKVKVFIPYSLTVAIGGP